MTSSYWILGALDPEMTFIEAVLREHGQHVLHAVAADGRRVTPSDAYRAHSVSDSAALHAACDRGGSIYLVECEFGADADWTAIRTGTVPGREAEVDCAAIVQRVDHHRPGDPGYGRPPAEYLSASSLGQVLAILGIEPTDEYRLVAAADHCLAKAYRGQCPGVDPDALMRWRIASRAQFQGRSEAELLGDVERARDALRAAPCLVLAPRTGHCVGPCCGCGPGSYGSWDTGASTRYGSGDCYCGCADCAAAQDAVVVADMRGQHMAELPEASAREGRCFVADGLPGRDGRVKVICQSGTPEQIEAFMRWAQAGGLVDLYGDPARGFAGGYR